MALSSWASRGPGIWIGDPSANVERNEIPELFRQSQTDDNPTQAGRVQERVARLAQCNALCMAKGTRRWDMIVKGMPNETLSRERHNLQVATLLACHALRSPSTCCSDANLHAMP